MVKAKIVRERNDAYDMQSGPHGYERIGFEIGGRVFWTGLAGSYMDSPNWTDDKKLAEDIVDAWNSFVARGERN